MGELYRLDFANGKSYIGISETSAKERFYGHRADSKKKTKRPIYNAWRKYGEPKMTVLAVVENYDLAETEIRAIKVFGTLVPNGYNSTTGGDVSPMKSPEVAAKVSKAMKGKLWTKERREKFSEKMKGNKNLLGHVHSQESRSKMSSSRKGVKFSEDRNNLISKSLKGKKRSKETIEKNKAAARSWMASMKENFPERWKEITKKRGEAIKASFLKKKISQQGETK